MGTQGVEFKKTKSEICESIKKHKGRLTKVAKEFNICYQTIRNHTDKFPELVELIKNLRQDRDENLLDEAEDTIQDALEGRSQDMGSALKSAFFVLNNKGKSRGYTPPNAPQEPTVNSYTTDQIRQSITVKQEMNDK